MPPLDAWLPPHPSPALCSCPVQVVRLPLHSTLLHDHAVPAGFRTQFQGYSVRFSPFEPSKLAVATSQVGGQASPAHIALWLCLMAHPT